MEKIEGTMERNLSTKDNILSAMSPLRIELSERILGELIGVMNEVHEVNYSYRFWKILIGDYIGSVISKKRYFEEKLIERKPELEVINGFEFPTFTQKMKTKLIHIVKHVKTLESKKFIQRQLREKEALTLGFPDIAIVKEDLGEAMPIHYPVFFGFGNTRKRARTLAIAMRYNDFFYRNVVLQIPRIYIEYFDEIYESIPLIEPERKVFHVHNLYSLYHKMLISKYIEHGAKLFWYQHGAFYGEFTGHNAHYHESSVADEFRTWGWKIRDNDVPWKAYRLEQFRMQYEMEKKEKRYDCLMCYSALYAGNISFYTSVTNYFLENIDPNKYRQILARPRPIHKLHSQAFQLSFIADERVIKDSALGNMTEAIAQSKIVIQFSVPSTNFLECFYVNHPTIGVLNNIEPTLIIKKYYDFFIEMGVLHKDFTSLVNHLNSIKIDEWWQEVILHPVFKSFKNEFLNNRMDL